MAFFLPDLGYAMDALAPHISAETLEYHYGKHHQAYVTNLNKLIEGTAEEQRTLEDLVRSAAGGVFNNAAQVFNHTFYWRCLSPAGGDEPTGAVAEALNGAFGSFAAFKEEFTNAAATHFGSGWVWLVAKGDGSLVIETTVNAGCPIRDGRIPLLTCDVWEHAYYVDYRNARPSYIKAFWHLVNWEFVAANMASS